MSNEHLVDKHKHSGVAGDACITEGCDKLDMREQGAEGMTNWLCAVGFREV